MKKDWKSIAHALGVEPIDDRALVPLNGLEIVFRPLAEKLTQDDDIAVDYAAVLRKEAE